VPAVFTDSSLAKVRAALVEQDQLLRCGMVMDPDSMMSGAPPRRTKIAFRLPRASSSPCCPSRSKYDAGDVGSGIGA
jgi:hypothetical protein